MNKNKLKTMSVFALFAVACVLILIIIGIRNAYGHRAQTRRVLKERYSELRDLHDFDIDDFEETPNADR